MGTMRKEATKFVDRVPVPVRKETQPRNAKSTTLYTAIPVMFLVLSFSASLCGGRKILPVV